MPALWMPGAIRVPASRDGGSMTGGPSVATPHTYEASYGLSALNGQKRCNAAGTSPHVTINVVTGQVAQGIPANRAARALRNRAGGPQTNRYGRVNIQCEFIGFAANPFTAHWTNAGRDAVAAWVDWCESWGVERRWVVAPYGYPKGGGRRMMPDGSSGFAGHSAWVENTHGDPGALDAEAFLHPHGHVTPPPVDDVRRGYRGIPAPLVVDGQLGDRTIDALRWYMGIPRGNRPAADTDIKAWEQWAAIDVPDGALQRIEVRTIQTKLGVPRTGILDAITVAQWQRFMNIRISERTPK